MVGYRVLQAVAGQGLTLAHVAACRPGADAVRIKPIYLSLRYREALDALALEIWGARGPQGARWACA